MFEVTLGVVAFTLIVLSLVGLILFARGRLVPSGHVTINVNGERDIASPVGPKLLGALADDQLFISSACGGGGTCGQCKVKVLEGGGELLPTETSPRAASFSVSCASAPTPIRWLSPSPPVRRRAPWRYRCR